MDTTETQDVEQTNQEEYLKTIFRNIKFKIIATGSVEMASEIKPVGSTAEVKNDLKGDSL